MRHIVATGCGFTLSGKELPVPGTSAYIYGGTYNCTGVPKFKPAYQYTEVVPGGTNSMDNYYNLPQKIKGFIMTLNPVIKMDQITVPGTTSTYATPVAPEVSCTKDADPLDPTSVANEDYTDYYLEYTDRRLYVEVEGRTYGGYAGMWDVNYTDVNRETYELKPGALEPMIDTMFPPVGVNLPTIPDLRTTGGFVIDKLTNSWHTLIEGTLSDLYRRINSIHTDTSTADGLINLENAKNMEGACDNFQIQVIQGSTVIGTSLTYPVYAVSGGTIRVEESVFEVIGATMSGAIFDSYLEVYKDENEYKGRVMETPPGVIPDKISGYPHEGHVAYEFIGNVRKVTAAANSPRETSERLSEYVINQADCIYEIILGGTGGGGSTVMGQYNGPFKVRFSETSESEPSVMLDAYDCIDKDGNTVCYTGHIFINGEWTCRADIHYLPVTGGSYDIYLHVGPGGTQRYDNLFKAAKTEYTIRLARVYGISTIVYSTTVTGGTPMTDEPDKEGVTAYNLSDVSIGGATVTTTPQDEDLSVTTITGATIHMVSGGTFTGKVMKLTGTDTAVIAFKTTGEIEQIHHGDVYVDGRWA